MELDNFDNDVKQAEDNLNVSTTDKHLFKKADPNEADAQTDGDSQPENQAKGPTVALGLHDGISNADYHKGPGISSTSLKYAVKAPILYHESMLGHVPFEETEAMRLGSAVHKLTLEALDFGSEIAISKKFGRKKADQEEKAEFYKANEGMIIIDADQYEKCRYMRDSLMALPDIADIFATGKPEQSGYYIDRETNMLAKYRPDWRTDWCIFDIKTTTDISEGKFARTVHDFGYHISAAHYLDGDKITSKTDHNQFIFGCVESKPPYLAAMYTLGPDSLEFGRWQRRKALTAIKKGRDTGEWPLYNHGVTTQIDIPSYAMYEFQKGLI